MAGDTGRATLAEGTFARRRAPGGRRCVADRGLSSCLARQLRSAGLHGAVGAPACARGTAPQGGWCSVAPFSSSSRWAHAAGVRTHARCAHPTLISRRSPHEVRRSCRQRHTTCAHPDGADDHRWGPAHLCDGWSDGLAQDVWEMWRRTSGERRNSCGSLQRPLPTVSRARCCDLLRAGRPLNRGAPACDMSPHRKQLRRVGVEWFPTKLLRRRKVGPIIHRHTLEIACWRLSLRLQAVEFVPDDVRMHIRCAGPTRKSTLEGA